VEIIAGLTTDEPVKNQCAARLALGAAKRFAFGNRTNVLFQNVVRIAAAPAADLNPTGIN
jgi:hypothetical protein